MNIGARFTLVILIGACAIGCASLGQERARVRSIAASRVQAKELLCTQSELTVYLDEDDGKTREWIAGCNFKAIRVRCTGDKCDQVVQRTWREELYDDSTR
jgi:hypothetical protein